MPARRPDEMSEDEPLLRDHVRSLDENSLVALLGRRPELLAGAPPLDRDDLAARLAHPAYVGPALDRLDVASTMLLTTLAMLGPRATVSTATSMLDPGDAGPAAHADAVSTRLDELMRACLVVPRHSDDDGVTTTPGVREVVAPIVGGSSLDRLLDGASEEELAHTLHRWDLPAPSSRRESRQRVRDLLSDPEQVTELLASADDDQRRAFVALCAFTLESVSGAHRAPDREIVGAAHWAKERGLAWPSPYGGLPHVPREVALGLLADAIRVPFPVDAPPLTTVAVDPDATTRAVAGAATETLSAVMGVVERLARQPVTTRKDGSVGAREITRLAKAVPTTPALVRFALRTANQLRLLAWTGGGTITVEADEWRRRSPAQRYADLLRAWWPSDDLVVRDRDLDGGAAAIGGPPTAFGAQVIRRSLLTELGEVPAGRGVTSGTELLERLTWARPNLLDAVPYDVHDPKLADDVLAEAELLGAVALGTLSGIGHALVEGRDADVVREADVLLPGTTDRATFGSDLTVLVPGNPSAHVVDLLDTVADREARGAANSWRFTDASLRSALDAGHDVDDLLQGLRELSDRPLPQPLEYFARDVARRYGQVGIRSAGAVLVGDEALLAELVAHSGLRRLGLSLVAPTVALASASRDDALAGLRKAGYLPRPENPDGSPAAAPIRLQHRTSDLESPQETPDGQETPQTPDPVVNALRLLADAPPPVDPAVEELLAEVRRKAKELNSSDARQLAFALAHHRPVLLLVDYQYAHRHAVLHDPVSTPKGVQDNHSHHGQPPIAWGSLLTATPLL